MVRRANWGALLIGVAAMAMPAATIAASPNGPSLLIASPDMLGTRAIPIRADRFAESIRRAREDATSSPLLQRMVAPAASDAAAPEDGIRPGRRHEKHKVDFGCDRMGAARLLG